MDKNRIAFNRLLNIFSREISQEEQRARAKYPMQQPENHLYRLREKNYEFREDQLKKLGIGTQINVSA
ncbi:MAG: hypothetical protein ACE5ES_05810 [Candidatus Nanoarchaeia archaeon]